MREGGSQITLAFSSDLQKGEINMKMQKLAFLAAFALCAFAAPAGAQEAFVLRQAAGRARGPAGRVRGDVAAAGRHGGVRDPWATVVDTGADAAYPMAMEYHCSRCHRRFQASAEAALSAWQQEPVPPPEPATGFLFGRRTEPAIHLFGADITPPGEDPAAAPANHSPLFHVDESGLPLGVRLLANLVADYQATGGPR